MAKMPDSIKNRPKGRNKFFQKKKETCIFAIIR